MTNGSMTNVPMTNETMTNETMTNVPMTDGSMAEAEEELWSCRTELNFCPVSQRRLTRPSPVDKDRRILSERHKHPSVLPSLQLRMLWGDLLNALKALVQHDGAIGSCADGDDGHIRQGQKPPLSVFAHRFQVSPLRRQFGDESDGFRRRSS